jgi:hypothetical protein
LDAMRFDRLTRTVSAMFSRRGMASTLGLTAIALSGSAAAKKKRKKKKKVKRNAFGCVNVGNFCKNAGQCCSGICGGKKGKKKCQAHDAEGCIAGPQDIPCGGGMDVECTSSAGEPGFCNTTTGNAGYCANDGGCFACSKDADCQEFCGPAAACILCGDDCAETGTRCVGPDECLFP